MSAFTWNARPEPVSVDLKKSAVVVVDMQNAFASKQGMLDLAGVDISGAPRVVESIRSILDEARPAGNPVAYLQMGYQPDLSDSGGPSAPNWQFFTGIATNVCAESTLRDAFFLDYWPLLITDATMAAGQPALHDATVENVENFFGWTLLKAEFIERVRLGRGIAAAT